MTFLYISGLSALNEASLEVSGDLSVFNRSYTSIIEQVKAAVLLSSLTSLSAFVLEML